MKRSLVVLGAAAATLFAASAAQAGGVNWSVGVNLPPVGAYLSGGPAWYPAPVRYAPPVVYAPAPVYAEPYLSVYDAPVYSHRSHYVPAPRWHHGGNRHDRWHHDGGHRR